MTGQQQGSGCVVRMAEVGMALGFGTAAPVAFAIRCRYFLGGLERRLMIPLPGDTGTEREYSRIHQGCWFHSRVSASRNTDLSAFRFVSSQGADLLDGVKLPHGLSAFALWVLLGGAGGWNGSWWTRHCFKLSSTK